MTTAPTTIESLTPRLAPVRERLARLRTLIAAMLGLRSLGITLAVAAAACGGLMLLDGILRLPASIRWINFVLIAAWLSFGVGRAVWAVMRTRPALVDLALLLGDAEGNRVAAAIDLAGQPPEDDSVAQAMRVRALERLVGGTGKTTRRAGRGLRSGRVAMPVLAALGALGGLSAFGVLSPGPASIAFARTLAPWGDAAWPTRVVLDDHTPDGVQPADEAVLLSVAAARRTGGTSPVRVVAQVRLTGPGAPERARSWTRYVLTPQGRSADVPIGADETAGGEIHERLIDTGAFALRPDLETFLEYELIADDARTSRRRIELVSPPRLTALRLRVTPPAYAAGLDGVPAGGRDLLTLAEPADALAGSRVELQWSASRSIPSEGTPDWRTLLRDADAVIADDTGELGVLGGTVSFDVSRDVRGEIGLRDEHGITSREPGFLLIDALPDGPPAAVIAEPARDESVLASARVEIVAEGADDLALHGLRIDSTTVERSGGDGDGTPTWDTAAVLTGGELPGRPRDARAAAAIDLEALGLREGDEVWVAAVSTDLRQHALGEPGARSTPRRLRIITPETLTEQLRTELAGVRSALRRLDDAQRELEQALDVGGATPALARRQRALADRIESQREQIQDVLDRQQRNRLDDGALRSVAEGASSLLSEAQQSAEAAASAAASGENEQTSELQRETRDRLGEAAQRLDEGEDAWQARRSLERLLEEQRELNEATSALGDRLLGRTRDELSDAEAAELDELVRRQEEAAERAREALDELTDRAEALRESDAVQSAALERAAQRGRSGALGEQLEDAAQQLEQNRSGEAQQQQQAAVEALEQMLADVDDANRNRDAALRRQIATLRSSIEGLIFLQRTELERLDEAVQTGAALLPLRDGMERLRVNTLGVRAEGESGFGELREAAGALDAAAETQGRAAGALGAVPSDANAARADEQRSLAALERALREAERADEEAAEREQERVQRELREAYRGALDAISALVEPTAAVVDRDLSRRDRAEARRLAGEHETVAEQLRTVRDEYEAVREAPVLDFAHTRLDGLLADASEGLRASRVARAVPSAQRRAMGLLRTMLEALEPDRGGDDFEGGASGGGGGGGAQSGEQNPVPPLAELLILRGMQEQLAEATRAADDAGDAGALEALAEWQRELGAQARSLIERARDQQGGGGAGPAEPIEPDRAEPAPVEADPAEPGPAEPDAGAGGTTPVEGS